MVPDSNRLTIQCGKLCWWRNLTWGRRQIQNALLHESKGHLLQEAPADKCPCPNLQPAVGAPCFQPLREACRGTIGQEEGGSEEVLGGGRGKAGWGGANRGK